MNTPLYNRLSEYAAKNRISFAMPGHKGNITPSLVRLDVTELYDTADLHAESAAVKAANSELSKLYGTKKSFIMTSGSTGAVFAMLLSALRPGDTLLAGEDCHISVINACIFAGVRIAVIKKELDAAFLVPKRVYDIEKYFDMYENIRAVLVTSPNYYGICEDLPSIYESCKKHGALLLVDSAHGAHFAAGQGLPEPAARHADLVCNSAHKTLNALTGAAYLHVCSDMVSSQKVRSAINTVETTSPSYPIAASADIAREALCRVNWAECIKKCTELGKKLKDLGLSVLDNDDPTRLVINFANAGISGFFVRDRLLEEYGIDVEMADISNIVLIATPYNIAADFGDFYNAVSKIIKPIGAKTELPHIDGAPHNGLISPREAYFKDGIDVELDKAAGRISKATVAAYPPGTPVIITGERIRREQTELLKTLLKYGAKISGLNGNRIETVKE